jgi:hypothetical protein
VTRGRFRQAHGQSEADKREPHAVGVDEPGALEDCELPIGLDARRTDGGGDEAQIGMAVIRCKRIESPEQLAMGGVQHRANIARY